MCIYSSLCVHVCVCVYVRACVHVCVCMHVCVSAHSMHGMYMEVRENLWQSVFTSTMWILRLTLKSSDLVASAFTH